MKIVVLDGYTENPGDLSWDRLASLGELKVYDRTADEDILDRIKGYDVVLINKTPMTRETIYASDTLKYIGVIATGYNCVDIEAAKEKGIPVVNAPGYSTASVTQATFSLLLELTNHVGDNFKSVDEGGWIACPDDSYWVHPLSELNGKTLGIIGYGAIGQAVGKVAKAFGMNLLVNSRNVKPELEDEQTKYVSYDEIFANSDYISLHCPLFPETKEIICKENIAKMKDGVKIVNTSRGGLINEKDMREALESGKVAGLGVDVISVEPMIESCPLYHAPNCIITPHLAWAAIEARTRLMDMVCDGIEAFINGNPINVVNP